MLDIEKLDIEKLENSGALTVLVALYKINHKSFHNELRKKSNVGVNTLDKRLLELKSLGLIDEMVEDKFGGKRYIWLTTKGKQIAEKLIEIEEILKEK